MKKTMSELLICVERFLSFYFVFGIFDTFNSDGRLTLIYFMLLSIHSGKIKLSNYFAQSFDCKTHPNIYSHR